MPIQRFDGFPSAYELGEGGGSYISKLADSAANAACGLYRDFPGAVIPASQIISLNPSANMVRGVWDGLCKPRNSVPPAPVPAVQGGQCKCTGYRWTARFRTNPGTTEQQGTGTFTGRAEVINRPSTTSSDTQLRTELYSYPCSGGVETGQRVLQHAATYAKEGGYDNITIVKIDGTPDTCGNQPPTYPPSVIPPGRGSGTTNVNLPGITVPVGFAYVPVSFVPTLNLSPQIRVDLGGLNFQFDLGGVSVNFPDIAPAPAPAPQIPGGNSSKPDCPPCPECPPAGGGGTTSPPPGSPELPPTEGQPTPGTEEDAPGIRYLEVVVTKSPDKVHFGDGGANAIFAGWVAFRATSGGYFPRQQINFAQSIFEAPPNSNGYTLTFTNGAEGRAREYTLSS